MTKDLLYMVVTADEYEFPMGVFESESSIARRFRVCRSVVCNAIRRKSVFQKKYYIILVSLYTDQKSGVIIESQRQRA